MKKILVVCMAIALVISLSAFSCDSEPPDDDVAVSEDSDSDSGATLQQRFFQLLFGKGDSKPKVSKSDDSKTEGSKSNGGGGILNKITSVFTGSGNTPLNGAWVTDPEGWYEQEWKIENGDWEMKQENVLLLKGTYKTSGNSITFTRTHFHGDSLPSDSGQSVDSRWYSKNDLKRFEFISDSNLDRVFVSFAGTYTGETLTFTDPEGDTIVLIKKTWTAAANSTFGTSDIYAVCWGNGKFVAGGRSGKMAYSTDGINWTPVADSTFGNRPIYAVTWGNGKFVAGGAGDDMAYSTDGINWTRVTNRAFATNVSVVRVITWGNGKFIAGGDRNEMAYSTDGINWTPSERDRYLTDIEGIAWGNNKFVAVGDGRITYSADGITWTDAEVPTFTWYDDHIWQFDGDGIIWVGNKFVAVGNLAAIVSSPDGINWSAIRINDLLLGMFGEGTFLRCIAFGNNTFVVGGGQLAHSTDGVNWTKPRDIDIDEVIWEVAWGGNKFVAVGNNGTIVYWQP